MDSFAEKFIRAYQAGLEARLAEQRAAEEGEHRKLLIDTLRLQQKWAPIIRRQEEAERLAKLQQGMPGERIEPAVLGPPGPAPTAELPQPIPPGAPAGIQALLAGRKIALQGAPIPREILPGEARELEPIEYPLSTGGVAYIRPQSRKELAEAREAERRQQLAYEQAKMIAQKALGPGQPVKLAPGEQLVSPAGEILAERPVEEQPRPSAEEYKAYVDAVIPPEGETAALNRQTKAAVEHHLASKNYKQIETVLQRAFDAASRIHERAMMERTRQSEGEAATLVPGDRDFMLAQVPAKDRDVVRKYLDYQGIKPSGFAMSKPYFQRIFGYVAQIDPTWDAKEWDARAQMVKNYSSGARSKEIDAIGAALGHAANLGRSIAALQNGDVRTLNRIANAIKVEIGQSPVTTFRAIVNRLGPEIVKAYVGTGGEASERLMQREDWNPDMSPAQLEANVAKTVELLTSKIGQMAHQWKTTMGREDFFERFLSDEAREAIRTYSPEEYRRLVYQRAKPTVGSRLQPAEKNKLFEILGIKK
jgi:hypothetical protein